MQCVRTGENICFATLCFSKFILIDELVSVPNHSVPHLYANDCKLNDLQDYVAGISAATCLYIRNNNFHYIQY